MKLEFYLVDVLFEGEMKMDNVVGLLRELWCFMEGQESRGGGR